MGDFDADGLTGLAILVLALRKLGLDVAPYVPDRAEEGHGLSLGAVDMAVREGRTLLLTADTGSTSHAEIATARERGVAVIVTDHHQLPGGPPDAAAVVNPHRADSHYPDRRLSGSGVAFKVAQVLLTDEPDGPAFALGLADSRRSAPSRTWCRWTARTGPSRVSGSRRSPQAVVPGSRRCSASAGVRRSA